MNGFVSLMYHNVCSPRDAAGSWPGFAGLSPSVTSYFVDRESFALQCSLVADTGRALDAALDAAAPGPEHSSGNLPGVHITFDDGWRGTLDEAGPVLESQALTAMLFVTTDLIGHPWFLSRAQIAGCSRTFIIGAHGRSHRRFIELSDAELREELSNSKATLEDILGREVPDLAFPGGAYDARVLRIATEAGYRQLFTSDIGANAWPAGGERSDGQLIKRVAIKSNTRSTTFRRYLAGRFGRERLRNLVLSGLKHSLGRQGYAALRGRLLAEVATDLEMTDLSQANESSNTPTAFMRSL